jgi:Ca2+-binding RTX toxin-like protein
MSYPTTTILVPFAKRLPVPNGRLTPTQRGSANKSTITTTLVIFDSQVADLPLLYNALLPGSIAHTIQPHQDSIDTITHLLTQTGATKLAIVAHGQPGAIQIGNGVIDRAMLETRSGLLQEWGLDSIALYSCEVGLDAEFIDRLGELTGAQIAASPNKLGAGNWELDGGMELLEIDRLADYSSTLTAFNGTTGDDGASAYGFLFSPPYLLGFTGGTVADLTDPIGDTFNGNDGNDYVNAASGDDIIDGGNGNDTLYGNNGNDILTGGDGINYLDGGDGNDRINADYMRDTVDGGTGNDFLYIETVVPNDAYTVIFTGANAGKFQINGADTGTFTGIEQLYFGGFQGNDTIDANLANLSVTPGGTASVYGTFGLNIYTNSGNDIVLGSAGKDNINGGNGDDALYGQGGDDTIFGGAGFDTIFGGAGIDTLSGGESNDFIFGGTENDIIKGDDGEDYLYGEDGDDNIKGGYGFDIIYGQVGNDTIYGEGVTFDAFGNDTTVAPAAGVGINDTIFGGLGNDFISGGIGDDVLLGEEGLDSIISGAGNDFVYGGIGNDRLFGDAGNDYIVGQDGNDTLQGGDGIDYFEGGDGIDYLYGGDQLNFLGDNSADYLYGNAGNDFLFGQAGDDFLDGGDGNDLLNGDDGNDVLFGVEGDDSLYGFAGVDYLYGGNGTDTLYGYAGSDFLIGGAGSDTFGYVAMADAGDTITDFDPSVDKLSFTSLFASLTPIVPPSAAVTTDYLRFVQFGTSTLVQIDPNGLSPGPTYTTMATLNNVTASSLIPTINVLV